jgi:hypothetical protein
VTYGTCCLTHSKNQNAICFLRTPWMPTWKATQTCAKPASQNVATLCAVTPLAHLLFAGCRVGMAWEEPHCRPPAVCCFFRATLLHIGSGGFITVQVWNVKSIQTPHLSTHISHTYSSPAFRLGCLSIVRIGTVCQL